MITSLFTSSRISEWLPSFQQNQTVQYQYNADTINLSNVSTRADLTRELRNISSELNRAYSLNLDPAVDVLRGGDFGGNVGG
jgi:hypothetical protein